LINKQKTVIPTNEQKFGPFHQLLTNIKMLPIDDYTELLLNSEEIDNDYIYHLNIQKYIKKKTNYYLIRFHIGESRDQKHFTYITYEGSVHELKEFLLHIYYDEMI
jgi:hypothetical protein